MESVKSLALGQRLRQFREAKAWSLEELSKRSGVELNEIQAFEQNEDLPRIAILVKLAKALEVNVADIFRERIAPRAYELIRRADRPRISPLLQMSDAKVKDYTYEPLTHASDDKHLDAYLIEIPPFQGRKPHENLTHPGEEFIYILEGKVVGELGEERVELEAGDSLYLRSMIKHSFYNPFEVIARAISVIYPY